MIAIVDYGMGNLRSVEKALEYIGAAARVTRDPAEISRASRIILPGVGAFGAAMANLDRFGLTQPVREAAASGRPFLGICLGMQLLMDSSEEQGNHAGLGVIPGKVVRFPQPTGQGLKIPHMGWNSITIRRQTPLLDGITDGAMVYFVHSYFVQPPDEAAAAMSNHGVDFCSVIASGSVYATQFHPEKSGAVGLQMLKNFVEKT